MGSLLTDDSSLSDLCRSDFSMFQTYGNLRQQAHRAFFLAHVTFFFILKEFSKEFNKNKDDGQYDAYCVDQGEVEESKDIQKYSIEYVAQALNGKLISKLIRIAIILRNNKYKSYIKNKFSFEKLKLN